MITGGAGFIGSHIADAYLAAGHDVHIVDNLSTGKPQNISDGVRLHQADLLDREAMNDLFRSVQPEVVNHHAAQASVKVSTGDMVHDLLENAGGTARVVELCAQHGVQKVIYASSGGTVYGNPERLPLDESHPLTPVSPYGVSKLTGEHYVRLGAQLFGLRTTVVRYSNAFGPRQDPHGEAGVVAIFTGKMLAGEQCTIDGDGEQRKDYVYVGDIARANVLALTSGDGETLNIGSGHGTSVNKIFDALKEHTGTEVPPRYGPPRPGDVRDFWLDPTRATSVMGWRAEVDFEEGIRKTVEWYRARG
jgi:UDP-glucose 4-epimerase